MSRIFSFILLLLTLTVFSQKNIYNTKKDVIAHGYDVVAYFSNKAIKGSKKISFLYEGVIFNFSSKENLIQFKANPKKYTPQYGGFCAYAVGIKGEKVGINPKTFEIRDGKLYLFYNSWGTNTLQLWLNENPNKLKKQADKNWQKIIQ